ncbi:MAG: hypothetical protein GXY77_05015 [Fibrobacter sp.]|nr:hypothetical protein [Fibrobacter sp.]
MVIRRHQIVVLFLLTIFISSGFARNILEKKMYYLTNTNQKGQARFWTIYLGNHDCKVKRKYPGEPEAIIDASINLQYLSSGYIEGNGYSAKGKIDCMPTMKLRNASGERNVTSDSIDFFFDFGRKVQLINGESGDLILDVEGDQKVANRFLMREYKLTEYFGEEILKEGSEETPLRALSFSKEGLERAIKAQTSLGE